jgi:predicted class III extradiol MEMO1 family dioxygenase
MITKKKNHIIIIISVVILITALILFTLSFRLESRTELRGGREKSVERSVSIPQTTNQYQKLITPNLNNTLIYSGLDKVEDDDRYTQKIQAMIVPHHDLAYDIPANAFYNLSRLPEDPPVPRSSESAVGHPRGSLILIGPNHSDIGDCNAISSLSNWQTDFGILETDKEAIEKLKSDGQVCLDEKTFETEHSLAVLTPAIKKFFPNSK